MNTQDPQQPRPPFCIRLSVTAGNAFQLAGLVMGAWVLLLAGSPDINPVIRVGLMLLGSLMIYLCCHALGHWVIGRLMGIRFRGYGIRGTNHPDALSPLVRLVLTRLPMFTALTDKHSMANASRLAKALMLGAGETSTIICLFLIGMYAWNNIPGGPLWMAVAAVMSLSAVTSTIQMPTGDYARAIKAWRGE